MDEYQGSQLGVLDAVETGDVLEMLLAQRRLMARSLEDATDGTRPQFNNELNKLHALIRDEQDRRAALAEAVEEGAKVDDTFDPSAI